MDLNQKLSQVPKTPGVYFFRNIKGEIIYIGKAKVLRNRIRSYFNKLDKTKHDKIFVLNVLYDSEIGDFGSSRVIRRRRILFEPLELIIFFLNFILPLPVFDTMGITPNTEMPKRSIHSMD